ncbi:MAG: YdcH family protein [Acidiferrobacter sp.]
MYDDEVEALKIRLEDLQGEHRDLDDAVARLSRDPRVDQLQLCRLKKRKLRLKDMIARLRSRLIPDLNA